VEVRVWRERVHADDLGELPVVELVEPVELLEDAGAAEGYDLEQVVEAVVVAQTVHVERVVRRSDGVE
jgi:hypothetical protein